MTLEMFRLRDGRSARHGSLLHVGETQLTAKGILREKDAASGGWVEFTHIRRGDRRALQSLIARLPGRTTDDLGSQPIEELCGPGHLCLLYTSREEQLAAVIPFVRSGLKRGERCVYIVDDNVTAIMDDFRAAGIPVEDATRTKALLVLTKRDTYLQKGEFDPQWMLQFLQDEVASARRAGFAALRVTGEVNWIETRPDATRFLEYESKVNEIIPQTGLLGLCQYHRRRIVPEMLPGILDTHPRIVENGCVQSNSQYGRLGGRETQLGSNRH